MNKRGQLGLIEMKFFTFGVIFGFIGGLVLIFLGAKEMISFKIPLVCGSLFLNKKGQLGPIEFKFFLYGVLFGFIAAMALTYLGTSGTIPFPVSLICG